MTRWPCRLARPCPTRRSNSSVHRLADLAAEATRIQGGRFTRDELAVEPSGAASPDLRLDRQVGTHRQRDALAADGILKPAELDDAARRGVACGVQVGQANMVSTSVDSVDNGVGGALELVIEPTRDKPTDDWRRPVSVIERKVSDAPFDVLIGEFAMDALDDVGPLAQRSHDRFCVLRQAPSRRAKRLGEARALEFLHAANQNGASESLCSRVGARSKVDNTIMLRSLAGERAIELGPTIGLDLGIEVATDLAVASRPELERGKMRSAGAHALADVVAGDHKVAAVVALAAYDDMDVGIIGVPVVDPNPIELGAEIPLGLRHQIAGERLQVRELLRILLATR